jgi:hypothetical protein
MTGPLDGPRAKVARARKHIKAFDRKIAALGKPGAHLITVRRYLDTDDQSWVLRLTSVAAIDVRWAVIFGEVAHDLRSALDHMTYALAFIDSRGKPGEKVQFPIVSSPAEFKRDLIQKTWLRGLTQRHRRFIARCQPYRIRKGEPNPLALLNDLSNDDKHRVLQPSVFHADNLSYTIQGPAGGVGWTDCTADPTRLMTLNYPTNPFVADTELVRIPLFVTGPNPKVDVKVNAALFVAFRNGVECLGGLTAIANRVEEILNESAIEFATQRRWQLPSSRFPLSPQTLEFSHTFTPEDQAHTTE